MDKRFLQLRADRTKPKKEEERICTYKFWSPPPNLRSNLNAEAVAVKLMFRLKAKMALVSPYNNMAYNVAGVAFVDKKPIYIINSAVVLQTDYVPVHEGMVMTPDGHYMAWVGGLSKKFQDDPNCDEDCDCLQWFDMVMEYLKRTKCRCGHHYDYYNEGRCKANYLLPPTRHCPFAIDDAKIFQLDPLEDFIKDTIENAVRSDSAVSITTGPSLSPSGLSIKNRLQNFLTDLSGTALIIPHLPDAAKLPMLVEWCRRRVNGDCSDREERRDLLKSFDKWNKIDKINFKARAYVIPFTEQELHNITWADRSLTQKLFKILLDDFVYRNRVKQLELARLLFPTMCYEKHPNRAFLECFFTYMPGRLWDTYFINPFSSILVKRGSKTCPLN